MKFDVKSRRGNMTTFPGKMADKQYLGIVKRILDEGEWKGNRTGARPRPSLVDVFEHDIGRGFPLLTTKKMPFKVIASELELSYQRAD